MLTASSPAKDAVVGRTAAMRLTFSAPVLARRSSAELIMTSMPGMADMPIMRMPLRIAAGEGGTSLILTAKAPLPAGTYRLVWTAAAGDGGKAAGDYAFTVR